MEYRTLGRTGVKVSAFCLGTLMCGEWGGGDRHTSIRVIHEAIEAGINFIDTADIYSQGEAEEIVGDALAGAKRADVVVATKFHAPMGDGINRQGNSRRWIHQAVDGSLRRLKTDWIDLYQVHRPDPTTDISETLAALDDLVRSGKVRYVGTSTFPASQIVEAQWEAERGRYARFVCEQPPYSILLRGIEAEVLPVCARHNIAVITWSPLAAGWLARKPGSQGVQINTPRSQLQPERFDQSIGDNCRKLEAVEMLQRLCVEAGIPLVGIALAFIMAHPGVTSAVIGARTPEQLAEQLAMADVRLDDGLLDRIDEIVPPGTSLNPEDTDWVPPSLTTAGLRRRPPIRVSVGGAV
jgi:aryl-alcohol dehydrogenase-like predicted oxidoreductase